MANRIGLGPGVPVVLFGPTVGYCNGEDLLAVMRIGVLLVPCCSDVISSPRQAACKESVNVSSHTSNLSLSAGKVAFVCVRGPYPVKPIRPSRRACAMQCGLSAATGTGE